ncbi:MAG: hypothetical protein WCO44_12765 [Bacteroidota bacterium]
MKKSQEPKVALGIQKAEMPGGIMGMLKKLNHPRLKGGGGLIIFYVI